MVSTCSQLRPTHAPSMAPSRRGVQPFGRPKSYDNPVFEDKDVTGSESDSEDEELPSVKKLPSSPILVPLQMERVEIDLTCDDGDVSGGDMEVS